MTVPSTDTWLIKEVDVWNGSGAQATVIIEWENAAGTIFGVFYKAVLANMAQDSFKGLAAGAPTDVLRLYTAGAVGVHVWVTGVELPGHV